MKRTWPKPQAWHSFISTVSQTWTIGLISRSGGNLVNFINKQFIGRFPFYSFTCWQLKLSKFLPLSEVKPIVYACH